MRTSIPGSIGILLFTTVVCLRAAAPEGELEITTHLYDYFGMDRPAAVHALQDAGTALRQGGINVQWEECLASAPATCNNEAIRGGACLEHQRARRTEARA